jgi:hypothetical protein
VSDAVEDERDIRPICRGCGEREDHCVCRPGESNEWGERTEETT